jgi:hypothetical protein
MLDLLSTNWEALGSGNSAYGVSLKLMSTTVPFK